MSEETIHESRRTRSRRAIASYLRRLADALGHGEPVPADEAQTVTVDVPAESDPDLGGIPTASVVAVPVE
jgi:hypothetical protein